MNQPKYFIPNGSKNPDKTKMLLVSQERKGKILYSLLFVGSGRVIVDFLPLAEIMDFIKENGFIEMNPQEVQQDEEERFTAYGSLFGTLNAMIGFKK